MTSPDLSSKIAEWRQKSADGTLTIEDTREYIKLLRADRMTAQASSETARRKRAVAAIPNADDALNELEGL